MSELPNQSNISAILARPSAQMTGHEVHAVKAALLHSVGVLAEAQLYDDVANVMKRDAHAAHEMLLRQDQENRDGDWAFPQIRLALMLACVEKMKAAEATWDHPEAISDEDLRDKAREAAFREEPGRWLPGATVSDVVLLRSPEFGVVRYRGREHVWIYAALTQRDARIRDLNSFLVFRPEFGGILVGPAGPVREIDLPDDSIFVAVDPGLDAPMTDGGAA